jgi:NAD(P)-dependent dehydrogenase (short-subunit alcohol dehydrogenase family)
MIIITGASRGIGKFLLNKYVTKGEKTIGTYNSSLPEDNIACYSKVDITDEKSVRQWINRNNPKKIILINCAGITYNSFAHKSDIKVWNNVINVNLIGTFNVIRCVLPIMREQNYGRIINFSSVVAQNPTPGVSAYAASKAGLWGLTKSIAIENASKGITINNLNLGYFNLGIIDKVPDEYKKNILEKIPTHKFGNPEQIIEAINFLIKADYLTGTSIDINGGIY